MSGAQLAVTIHTQEVTGSSPVAPTISWRSASGKAAAGLHQCAPTFVPSVGHLDGQPQPETALGTENPLPL